MVTFSFPPELCADVYRWQSGESQSTADEMISLTIGGVGCQAAVRTHTMELSATLAGITLKVSVRRLMAKTDLLWKYAGDAQLGRIRSFLGLFCVGYSWPVSV